MIRPVSRQIELSVRINHEVVIFYDKKGNIYSEIEFKKSLDNLFLQEIVKKGLFRKQFFKIKLDTFEFLFDETAYKNFMKDYNEVRNIYLATLQKQEIIQQEIDSEDESILTKKKELPQKKIVKPKKKNRKVNTNVNTNTNATTKTNTNIKEKVLPVNNTSNIPKEKYKKVIKQTNSNYPPKMKEVYNILNKALQNTGLNNYEIKNNIVVTTNVRQELDLQIDLHSLTLEVANNVLLNILNITQLSINQIKLIHGYNKGTILKNFIVNDFTHSRIYKKEVDATNEGITLLKLKAIDKSTTKKKKVNIKSLNNNSTSPKEKKNESIEAIKDAADFILVMIKEKVRNCDIISKEFNKIYESVLNEDECKYCNNIFNYNFELGFFLESLREFYEYKDTQYMKVSYKKKNYDECTVLLEKLIAKFAKSKIECVIKVDKNIGKKLQIKYNGLNDTHYQISLLEHNEVLLKGGL